MRTRPKILGVTGVVALLATALLAGPADAAASVPPTHKAYPAGGTNSLGPGISEGNTNAQLAERLPATIVPSWTVTPPICPSSGGANPSSIAVAGNHTVVLERQYQCSSVSTYDTATGKLIWRKNYHFATSAPVINGLVYVSRDNSNDGSWAVDALELPSGSVRWTKPIISDRIDSVGSGVLVADTQMLDLRTGSATPRLQIPAGTSGGKSLVAGGRVYRNSSTQVSAWSVATGERLWTYAKVGSSAGGDALPALHDGRLYVRSDSEHSTVKVLDPTTGKVMRQLPVSTAPLAFDGDFAFFTKARQNAQTFVTAVNVKTGVVAWSRGLPTRGGAWVPWSGTGPIVANGLVWMMHAPDTGTPAHLTAFDERTGATSTSTTLSCEPGTEGALTIAQQRLFASSNCGTVTFVAR